MGYVSSFFTLASIFIFAACSSENISNSSKFDSVIKIHIQVGNNTYESTAYKIENTYITAAHSVRSDSAKIFLNTGEKCQVQERDFGRDIAWILCGKEKNDFKKLYPNKVKSDTDIQIGVYRKGEVILKEGKVTDTSANIQAVDTQGNIYTLSGILMTDIHFEAGDSGAPIFEKSTGKWIGIVHTQ